MFCILGPRVNNECSVMQKEDCIQQDLKMAENTMVHSSITTPAKDRSLESSISHSVKSTPSSVCCSRGQVQLSLQVKDNRLIVQVLDAQNLQSNWTETCSSYVQLQMCPDEEQSTKCKTKVVPNSNCPHYNEKFTYELLSEDKKKRMMISAWNEDAQKKCPEFIGCLSFGVQNLSSKADQQPLRGWYHLLDEEVGHRKHIQANPPHNVTARSVAPSAKKLRLNKMDSLQTFSVVIPKCPTGYGFTVKGSCPVRLGRIKPGGPAHMAGLCRGDVIVKIEGQNVQRSSAESIAKIVRNSTIQLILDIHRPTTKTPSSNTLGSGSSSESVDIENIPPTNTPHHHGFSPRSSGSSRCHRKRIVVGRSSTDIPSHGKRMKRTQPAGSESKHSSHCATPKTIWNPEMSIIAQQQQSFSSIRGHTLPDFPSMLSINTTLQSDLTTLNIARRESLSLESSSSSSDASMNSTTHFHFLTPHPNKLSKRSSSKASYRSETQFQTPVRKQGFETSTEGHFLTPGSALGDESRVTAQASDGEEVEDARTSAICDLMDAENKFVEQMQLAITRYSRPLRAGILSQQEHATVFQNVEKLVAISQFHVRHLLDLPHTSLEESTLRRSLDNTIALPEAIGSTYLPRLHMLTDAYAAYSQGQEASFHLLEQLCSCHDDFITFMRGLPGEMEGELNLAQFLDFPVQHLDTITSHLRHVLECTPHQHSDFAPLCQVVEAMSYACQALNESAL